MSGKIELAEEVSDYDSSSQVTSAILISEEESEYSVDKSGSEKKKNLLIWCRVLYVVDRLEV